MTSCQLACHGAALSDSTAVSAAAPAPALPGQQGHSKLCWQLRAAQALPAPRSPAPRPKLGSVRTCRRRPDREGVRELRELRHSRDLPQEIAWASLPAAAQHASLSVPAQRAEGCAGCRQCAKADKQRKGRSISCLFCAIGSAALGAGSSTQLCGLVSERCTRCGHAPAMVHWPACASAPAGLQRPSPAQAAPCCSDL